MLPRSWCIAIVLLWLLMCSWLLWRDVWPRYALDEPKPFAIPLLDEPRVGIIGRKQKRLVETVWRVLSRPEDWRGDRDDVGRANTHVVYDVPNDALVFHVDFSLYHEDRGNPRVRIEECNCRVGWDGSLRHVQVSMYTRDPGKRTLELTHRLEAPVEGKRLLPQWWIQDEERSASPAELSPGGNLLIPVLPPNRLVGLRLGQRWRVPCLDVLGATLAEPRLELRQLQAEVREEMLSWRERRDIPCLVVEYGGEESLRPRTWARKSDLLVLQQEFWFNGERLILQRDSER